MSSLFQLTCHCHLRVSEDTRGWVFLSSDFSSGLENQGTCFLVFPKSSPKLYQDMQSTFRSAAMTLQMDDNRKYKPSAAGPNSWSCIIIVVGLWQRHVVNVVKLYIINNNDRYILLLNVSCSFVILIIQFQILCKCDVHCVFASTYHMILGLHSRHQGLASHPKDGVWEGRLTGQDLQ